MTESTETEEASRKPAIGLETRQWVLEAIKANPELHHQDKWEQATECGTAMCVAGWAAMAHQDVFTQKLNDHLTRWHGGCDNAEDWQIQEARGAAFRWTGQTVLGLSITDADQLFCSTSNAQAVQALEVLAQGGEVDWYDILGWG